MSNSTSSNYVPGVCNINPAEIKQRRMAGHVGLAIFVGFLVAMIAMDAANYIRVILFLPALISAIGYLQAKNKFCVGYAGSGLQHADDDDAAVKVADDAAVKDKKRAKQINLQALVIAVVVTALAVALPL